MRKFERTSGKPVYHQLADWIRGEIHSGALSPDHRLGVATDVAVFHSVRPDIAERALSTLQSQGWARADREGCWRISQPRSPEGTLLKWDPAGLVLEVDGEVEVKVLSKVTTSLSSDLLEIFEVHGIDGTRASRVIKLHQTGNLTLALETITAPMDVLPGLVMKDHRHNNFYSIIESQYRIEIESIQQRIHQRMLKPEEANNLAATPNFPALCLDRTVHSATQAVGFVEWVIPAGRCQVVDEAFRS